MKKNLSLLSRSDLSFSPRSCPPLRKLSDVNHHYGRGHAALVRLLPSQPGNKTFARVSAVMISERPAMMHWLTAIKVPAVLLALFTDESDSSCVWQEHATFAHSDDQFPKNRSDLSAQTSSVVVREQRRRHVSQNVFGGHPVPPRTQAANVPRSQPNLPETGAPCAHSRGPHAVEGSHGNHEPSEDPHCRKTPSQHTANRNYAHAAWRYRPHADDLVNRHFHSTQASDVLSSEARTRMSMRANPQCPCQGCSLRHPALARPPRKRHAGLAFASNSTTYCPIREARLQRQDVTFACERAAVRVQTDTPLARPR